MKNDYSIGEMVKNDQDVGQARLFLSGFGPMELGRRLMKGRESAGMRQAELVPPRHLETQGAR
jgi:hypothetical protein